MSDLLLIDNDAPIMERVCRLTLDCKIRVSEITAEMLRKSIYWDARDQESSISHAERQSRLLHALLHNGLALTQFLAYVVATDLCVLMEANPGTGFDVGDEDSILKSVYTAADEGSGPFINDSQHWDAPFDDIELFHACFKVDWSKTVLRTVEVLPGDDVSECISE